MTQSGPPRSPLGESPTLFSQAPPGRYPPAGDPPDEGDAGAELDAGEGDDPGSGAVPAVLRGKGGRPAAPIDPDDLIRWEGNEFFPADRYPGFLEPVGQMTMGRFRNNCEVTSLIRFPTTFGLRDLSRMSGRGKYRVRLWNDAHTKRLATVTLEITEGHLGAWPPARPPWETPDQYDPPEGSDRRIERAAAAREEPSYKAFSVTVGGQELSFKGDSGSILTGVMGIVTALAPKLVDKVAESMAQRAADDAARFERQEARLEALNSQVLGLYERIIDVGREDLLAARARVEKVEDRYTESIDRVFQQGIEYNTSFAKAIEGYAAQERDHAQTGGMGGQIVEILAELRRLGGVVSEQQSRPQLAAAPAGGGDIQAQLRSVVELTEAVKSVAAQINPQTASPGGAAGALSLAQKFLTPENIALLWKNVQALSGMVQSGLVGPMAPGASQMTTGVGAALRGMNMP